MSSLANQATDRKPKAQSREMDIRHRFWLLYATIWLCYNDRDSLPADGRRILPLSKVGADEIAR